MPRLVSNLTSVDAAEDGRSIDLSHGWRIGIRCTPHDRLLIELSRHRTTVAIGRFQCPSCEQLTLTPHTGGAEVCARVGDDRRRRWRLRLRIDAEQGLAEVIERAGLPGTLTWRLTGGGAAVNRGVRPLILPPEDLHHRLGGFTQYGQLMDLVDWVAALDADVARVMLALRTGCWSEPHRNLGQVAGDETGIHVDLPGADDNGIAVRRSYAFALESIQIVMGERRMPGDDSAWAAWPARQIGRLGFARPERLANAARLTESMNPARPEHCCFGETAETDAAARLVDWPELRSSHPAWCEDDAASLQWLEQGLIEKSEALRDGFLRPEASPVALRGLAPLFAGFHLLDRRGLIRDEQRQRFANRIAQTASLLHRRDYYPHHVATIPPGARRRGRPSVQNIYRGMLNQNFNTDRYCAVGMAGCVLPDHPWASAWREHFLQQFHDQMRSFVYPDGAWEESHTYHQHVLLCLLPVLAAMRHRGADAPLKDPRFTSMATFFSNLLSPRDHMLGGKRCVPPLGDHGYPLNRPEKFNYLFAWLFNLLPDLPEASRQRLAWAWRETGGVATFARSSQASFFSPLLMPARAELEREGPSPKLPALAQIAGYGVAARRAPHPNNESLLVIRCGSAWAHYHPDQGSFWWWVGGLPVAVDAGLADGDLKFQHQGHNTLGWPGRSPMQHLDHPDFRVLSANQKNEAFTIQCHLPCDRWRVDRRGAACDIPTANPAPSVQRTFHWPNMRELIITDKPTNAPEGLVEWRLWVFSENARRLDDTTVAFALADGRSRLIVHLPHPPAHLQFDRDQATLGLICLYPEQTLSHALHVIRRSSRGN